VAHLTYGPEVGTTRPRPGISDSTARRAVEEAMAAVDGDRATVA
jgi:hypothetical protein